MKEKIYLEVEIFPFVNEVQILEALLRSQRLLSDGVTCFIFLTLHVGISCVSSFWKFIEKKI